MKKRILGIVLCAAMVMSNSSLVFAETYDDGQAHTVEGGVSSSDGYGAAVDAIGEGTKVTVNGDVTKDSEGATAVNVTTGATVDVNGNVDSKQGAGIQAADGATVTVEGDVSGSTAAINVTDEDYNLDGCSVSSTVTVDGNVSGDITNNNSTLEITGNVTGNGNGYNNGAAVGEKGTGSTTKIYGDVKAASNESAIKTDGDSTIVITGTVTVSGDNSAVVFDHSTWDNTSGNLENNESASASKIVVYEIKGNTDNLVESGYSTYNPDPEFITDSDSTKKEEQIKNIFYIIKTAEGSSDNISSISNTTKIEGYDTAPQDTVLTVTVKEGYGVSAGTIEVKKNDDGTYTLTVPAGGGVTLTAEQLEKAIKETEEKGTSTVDTDTSTDDNANTSTEDNSNASVDPVNNASAEQTANNTSNSESSDNSSSNNQDPVWQPDPVQNLNPVNPSANVDPISMGEAGYEAKIVGMVANVAPGGKLELNITDAAYLSTMIVEALSIRNDVSLSLVVNYMGIPYTIDIPAGFDLKSLLGPDGKIDFAKLLATFGAKVK